MHRRIVFLIAALVVLSASLGWATAQPDDSTSTGRMDDPYTIRVRNNPVPNASLLEDDPVTKYVEEKLNIDIVYHTQATDSAYEQDVLTRLAAGNPYSIEYGFVGRNIPVTSWRDLLADDVIVDMNEIVSQEPERYPLLTKLFADPHWRLQNFQFNGDLDKNYGLHNNIWLVERRGAVIYNGSLLDRLGIEAPSTYAEFKAGITAAQEQFGVPGYSWVAYDGIQWDALDWHFFNPQGQFNGGTPRDNHGKRYHQDENGNWYDAAIDPGNKPIWEEIQTLYEQGAVDRGWLTPGGYYFISDLMPVDGIFSFDSNVSASPSVAQWVIREMRAAKPDAMMGEDVVIGTNPLRGPGGQTTVFQRPLGHWGIRFIPFTEERPDRILDLIEFIISEEGMDLGFFGLKGDTYTMDDKSDWDIEKYTDYMKLWFENPGPSEHPLWYHTNFRSTHTSFATHGTYLEALQKGTVMGRHRTRMYGGYSPDVEEYIFEVVWPSLERQNITEFVPFYERLVAFSDEELRIDARTTDVRNKWWTLWLTGEEDVETTWDDYVDEYLAAGGKRLEQAFAEKIEEAKRLHDDVLAGRR